MVSQVTSLIVVGHMMLVVGTAASSVSEDDKPEIHSELVESWRYGDSGTKRGTSVGPGCQLAECGLCVSRGMWHVTRRPPSSCSPLWMVQRTSVPLQFHPPPTPSSSSKGISVMTLVVRWQSVRFRWAHPPVASSPPDSHPSSSIEKRCALLPISCADLSIHLKVAKPNSQTVLPARRPLLYPPARHTL